MAGARSVAIGSVAVDSHPSPCLLFDALPLYNRSFRPCGDAGMQRWVPARRKRSRPSSSLELSSSFVDAWHGRRPSACSRRKQQSKSRGLVVINELAGQYEEGFDDVHSQLVNYFTFKAVRTVLSQLYEMNPPSYTWFYNFIAMNQSTTDGKRFLRSLGKEKQDLAERVMITRLHLYGKWIKKCDHAKMYQQISDENLQLMRERLMETVVWPSDDTNTEKIG